MQHSRKLSEGQDVAQWHSAHQISMRGVQSPVPKKSILSEGIHTLVERIILESVAYFLYQYRSVLKQLDIYVTHTIIIFSLRSLLSFLPTFSMPLRNFKGIVS